MKKKIIAAIFIFAGIVFFFVGIYYLLFSPKLIFVCHMIVTIVIMGLGILPFSYGIILLIISKNEDS